MDKFIGKKIVITGGTSGIGRAGALKIAAEGGRVFVTGRNPKRITKLRAELPSDSLVFSNDMSNTDSIPELIHAIRTWSETIDGLWLNAGIAHLDNLLPSDQSNVEAMIQTNLLVPRMQLASLAPLIKENGSVVITSSSSVYEGAAATGDYAAVKSGLTAAVRSWATNLASKQIRVNTIVPGAIETNFRHFLSKEEQDVFEKSLIKQVPLKRIGKPEEAAAPALFLLSDESSYITGSQIFVDGGLIRH
ncbi:oxidoreductase [Enterococcus silesiacus]|uniref:Oxidoreductase n=1 Tax=Enterococcus silesiacus TaxID=332949 RepID=A0ABN4J635_9ENTE|nr:SDR family oxidoreductase [Enterococcus silesiacus]ALS01341.1 oxidoreductase [Enterococcus silesiacus]